MDTTGGGHIITTETVAGTEHTKENVRQEIREIPIEDDSLITTIESNHVIRIQYRTRCHIEAPLRRLMFPFHGCNRRFIYIRIAHPPITLDDPVFMLPELLHDLLAPVQTRGGHSRNA